MVQDKVRAYTIIEVVVAMIIASISIAITYSAFDIIQKSYLAFYEKNKLTSEIMLTDRLLRRDFTGARMIRAEEAGISFIDDTGAVNYSFTQNYILRNQYNIRTDTLFLATTSPMMTFEDRPIELTGKVDKLSIQVIAGDKQIKLQYSKLYSSEDLSTDHRELRF